MIGPKFHNFASKQVWLQMALFVINRQYPLGSKAIHGMIYFCSNENTGLVQNRPWMDSSETQELEHRAAGEHIR
jgi:hypothetical protein